MCDEKNATSTLEVSNNSLISFYLCEKCHARRLSSLTLHSPFSIPSLHHQSIRNRHARPRIHRHNPSSNARLASLPSNLRIPRPTQASPPMLTPHIFRQRYQRPFHPAATSAPQNPRGRIPTDHRCHSRRGYFDHSLFKEFVCCQVGIE